MLRRALNMSTACWAFSQNSGDVLRALANLMASPAPIDVRPLTIRLITFTSQPMCSASCFCVMFSGLRSSSERISPSTLASVCAGMDSVCGLAGSELIIPLSVKNVNVRLARPDERRRWDATMAEHHPLGFRGFAGRGLRYIAEYQGCWLALLGWQSGAFKCRPRDRWIGWRPREQFPRLHLIANNTRMLMLYLPGTIPNLASCVVAANLRCLSADWQAHFGHRVHSLSVVAARKLRSRLLPRPQMVDSVPLSFTPCRHPLALLRARTAGGVVGPVSDGGGVLPEPGRRRGARPAGPAAARRQRPARRLRQPGGQQSRIACTARAEVTHPDRGTSHQRHEQRACRAAASSVVWQPH